MDANDIAALKDQVFDHSSTQSQQQQPAPDASKTVEDTKDDKSADDIPVDNKPIDNAPIDNAGDEEIVDANDFFKKEFGYDTIEDARKGIAELKAKAETKAEHKFANEQMKNLYTAITEGKTDEVKSYLNLHDKLSKVDALSAADALKLHIEQTNKHYTAEDVKDVFDEKYAKPSEPKQGEDELDADFSERTAKYKETVAKIDRRIERDAKEAKDALTQLATKLELPNLDKPVDENYENFKKQSENQKQALESEKQAYAKFTPKDIDLKFKFKDENQKLEINVNYVPDEKGFSKSIEEAGDLTKFFGKFYGEDGSPQREKFLKAVYVSENLDKIVGEAIKESVNQTRLNILAKAKNRNDGLERDFNIPLEKTEIQKIKDQVFG